MIATPNGSPLDGGAPRRVTNWNQRPSSVASLSLSPIRSAVRFDQAIQAQPSRLQFLGCPNWEPRRDFEFSRSFRLRCRYRLRDWRSSSKASTFESLRTLADCEEY